MLNLRRVRDSLFLEGETAPGRVHRLLFMGDVHWDHPFCDRDALRRVLDFAVEVDAQVVDLGDFLCLMQSKSDKRHMKHSVRPEHLVDDYFDAVAVDAAAFLAPYAAQYRVMLNGNHVTSVMKRQEINPLSRMLAELGRPEWISTPGYSSYVVVRLRRVSAGYSGASFTARIPIFVHHGFGGGQVTRGAIGAQRRALLVPDARYVFTGHIHSDWNVPQPRHRLDVRTGRQWTESQEAFSVNTFKDEYQMGRGGYGVEKGLSPTRPICWLLEFEHRTSGKVERVVDTVTKIEPDKL